MCYPFFRDRFPEWFVCRILLSPPFSLSFCSLGIDFLFAGYKNDGRIYANDIACIDGIPSVTCRGDHSDRPRIPVPRRPIPRVFHSAGGRSE